MVNRTQDNRRLKESFSHQIIDFAGESFDDLVLSSSFGEYSAVMLHLVTARIPDVPVINIQLREETDETRQHRERLTEMLDLNLRIYQEEKGESKAHVFSHALADVGAEVLLSGLMWEETQHRESFEYVMFDEDDALYRIHPILHWRKSDQAAYCQRNGLLVNSDYCDPNKEESEAKECGIHVFNYQQDGSGI